MDPPAGLGFGPTVAGQLMGLLVIAFVLGLLAPPLVAEKIFRGKYDRVAIIGAIVGFGMKTSEKMRSAVGFQPSAQKIESRNA